MASSTMKGQKLLKPIIQPIEYLKNKVNIRTVNEFCISPKDLATHHRVDHIRQNMELASKIKIEKSVIQKFKRSVLSRGNPQNLMQMRNKM